MAFIVMVLIIAITVAIVVIAALVLKSHRHGQFSITERL